MKRFVCGLMLLLASATATLAEELVRSDLPLWSNGGEGVWPADATSENGSPGHYTIFQPGDWRITARDCEGAERSDACQSWLRLSIASVFHGGFIFETASSRSALGSSSDGGVGVIAELETRRRGTKLFALQMGFRGGSTYWLLSVAEGTPIKRLTRLDVRCSDAGGHWRERKPRGYYLTGYCAVADKVALRLMAEAALNRPPLSTWEWIRSDEPQGQN
jgi:hypothetical protein